MQGHSYVELIGSLTQDAELRYTPEGLAILSMVVAGDAPTTIGGDVRELPYYIRVNVFGRYAEALADNLMAGTVVAVDGRVNYRSWKTEAGETRSTLEITANSVQTLQGDFAFLTDAKGQKRLQHATNRITLMGNLTRDPELRHTSNKVEVSRLTLAVNKRQRDEDSSRTHFVDITAWRELARAATAFKKGDPVRVVGRLTNDSWEDQDGNRRYAVRVEATELYAVARPSPRDETSQDEPQTERDAPPDEFPPEEDLPF